MDAPGPSAIGGTYVGNPVACAAANAVLEVIEEEGLMERADVVGKAIRVAWEQLAREVPEVGEIRGLGAMIGVEFVTDRETKEPDGAFVGRLMRRDAEARPDHGRRAASYHNVLRHLPPLVITDDQLDEALDVLADSALAARRPSRERGRAPRRRAGRPGARRGVPRARPRTGRFVSLVARRPGRRTGRGCSRRARRQRRGRADVDVHGLRPVRPTRPRCGHGSTCCRLRRTRCSSTVIDRASGAPVGVVSFMNVDLADAASGARPHLVRAARRSAREANTETVYLMLREAFDELGPPARRVEVRRAERALPRGRAAARASRSRASSAST